MKEKLSIIPSLESEFIIKRVGGFPITIAFSTGFPAFRVVTLG